MSYDELFSGEEVWLAPDCEPGWRPPWLKATDVVEMEVQPDADLALGPVMNLVVDRAPALEAVWGIEQGWSAFAVMVQNLGSLLSTGVHGASGQNLMTCEQHVVRNDDWSIKSTHYRVLWKGPEIEGI